jgi:stage II sporulation protein R
MKNGILQFSITLFLLTFFISVFPTEEDFRVYDDTLRLHILANSDSREDQDIKIAVRDLVLDRFGGELSEAEAIDSALMITEDMLEEIEAAIENFLKESGCDFGANVSLSREWYETRDYSGFTLPRGYYSSLVITLGEGNGQNWWCIMFPPLCRDLSTEDGGDESDGNTYEIGGERYTVKFKTLEILADLFKKRG